MKTEDSDTEIDQAAVFQAKKPRGLSEEASNPWPTGICCTPAWELSQQAEINAKSITAARMHSIKTDECVRRTRETN